MARLIWINSLDGLAEQLQGLIVGQGVIAAGIVLLKRDPADEEHDTIDITLVNLDVSDAMELFLDASEASMEAMEAAAERKGRHP